LKIHVSDTGRVEDVLVERSAGHQDLDLAAMEAVRQWRFEPARRGKQSVAVWVMLPVRFALKLAVILPALRLASHQKNVPPLQAASRQTNTIRWRRTCVQDIARWKRVLYRGNLSRAMHGWRRRGPYRCAGSSSGCTS